MIVLANEVNEIEDRERITKDNISYSAVMCCINDVNITSFDLYNSGVNVIVYKDYFLQNVKTHLNETALSILDK